MGKMVTTRKSSARHARAYDGYRELDLISIPEPIPELGIEAGVLGTVDHVYKGGRKADVEVAGDDGVTLGYVTISADPEPHVVAYYVVEDN